MVLKSLFELNNETSTHFPYKNVYSLEQKSKEQNSKSMMSTIQQKRSKKPKLAKFDFVACIESPHF
jgi:hypothetical protein